MLLLLIRILWISVITYLIIWDTVKANRRKVEESIQKYILQNYHHRSRPDNWLDTNDPLKVFVSFALSYIKTYDEKEGRLTSMFYVALRWHDSELKWNKTEYSGLTKVNMQRKDIWYPPLCLLNPADGFLQIGEGRESELVEVFNDGRIRWHNILMIDTVCAANSMYYPFDEQTCLLNFVPF